jgi:hypothetical protein
MARRALAPIAIALAALAVVLLAVLAFWLMRRTPGGSSTTTATATQTAPAAATMRGGSATNIYAHNLRLHQGPTFRVYVQWLRGQLTPTHKGHIPSFDDTESFYLNVTNGVIRANIGDICNYLNARSLNSPLTDINISGAGSAVKITGKFHKLISFPVELIGVLQPVAGNRVQVHLTHIDILKLPFKSLLGGFHLTLANLVKAGRIPGVEVVGNDIYFEPETLLPPPHIRGTLTSVSIANPDLQVVYGNTTKDVERVDQWRNFLRLRDGSVNFGKLTMNKVDLIMIDISQDAWFDLDLANYQAQLVNGYTRMTPQAGLQIFMPDLSTLKANRTNDVSIEWFKNRNAAPPPAVQPQK